MNNHSSSDTVSHTFGKRALVLVTVAVVFGVLYVQFRHWLNLETLAQHEEFLQDYQRRHPVLIYGIAFCIYVVVTGLSLPGAVVLSLAYAWFFGAGTWQGYLRAVVLISFASTTGATLAFTLSRYLFRDAIQIRFAERLATFNSALQRDGILYLLTLRLIPAVPFFVVNLVMGLTPMRARTFWWVSQLGMLPGTAVYVYAGWSFPSLQELAEHGTGRILSPQIITAFVLLGAFPFIVKAAIGGLKKDAS